MEHQHVDADHDPFDGGSARKARAEIRKRKQKELMEQNFEGGRRVSRLQRDAAVGWMESRIQSEAAHADDAQIELYLTEGISSRPKKWTDPIFRRQRSEKMKSGGGIGGLVEREFERRGFEFDFVAANGLERNLDPQRRPNRALVDDADCWDVEAAVKWGEDESGNRRHARHRRSKMLHARRASHLQHARRCPRLRPNDPRAAGLPASAARRSWGDGRLGGRRHRSSDPLDGKAKEKSK